jgi:hypothetical protein
LPTASPACDAIRGNTRYTDPLGHPQQRDDVIEAEVPVLEVDPQPFDRGGSPAAGRSTKAVPEDGFEPVCGEERQPQTAPRAGGAVCGGGA